MVSTSFGAEDPAAVQRLFIPFLRPFMKTPAQGAATSIHLASAPELEQVTGRYFANSKPKKSSERSYDEAAAARLWQVSADLVGLPTAADTAARPPLHPKSKDATTMNHDTRSLRTASLIAGLALALMAVLAAFGNFVAIQPLVTPGDAAKTAQDISNSEALFRWGIASLILVGDPRHDRGRRAAEHCSSP